eukprot:359472-Chlamydomonas_euryale.AAC.15
MGVPQLERSKKNHAHTDALVYRRGVNPPIPNLSVELAPGYPKLDRMVPAQTTFQFVKLLAGGHKGKA